MSELNGGWHRPLSSAAVYSVLQRALGANQVRRVFARTYVQAAARETVLDLGCGTGEILDHLPSVRYVGMDLSAPYLAAARARYGEQATFIEGDVRGPHWTLDTAFDVVMAVGALHHLDDSEATAVFAQAARFLVPGGRMVTIDPAFDHAQSAIARWLIARDRGANVRDGGAYAALAQPHFRSVQSSVRHDLARVPYTHLVMVMRGPRGR